MGARTPTRRQVHSFTLRIDALGSSVTQVRVATVNVATPCDAPRHVAAVQRSSLQPGRTVQRSEARCNAHRRAFE
jgi:hypothetical protein